MNSVAVHRMWLKRNRVNKYRLRPQPLRFRPRTRARTGYDGRRPGAYAPGFMLPPAIAGSAPLR